MDLFHWPQVEVCPNLITLFHISSKKWKVLILWNLFSESDSSVCFLFIHISALVISVVLWCCDLNLFICQLSPDTYHKLKTDWSRLHPSAQLSFQCPLKLEGKSNLWVKWWSSEMRWSGAGNWHGGAMILQSTWPRWLTEAMMTWECDTMTWVYRITASRTHRWFNCCNVISSVWVDGTMSLFSSSLCPPGR